VVLTEPATSIALNATKIAFKEPNLQKWLLTQPKA
jgi:hypothetical protein